MHYLALGCALLMASSVQAEGVKVGVVNVALLLEEAPQAAIATENLKKEFAKQQQDLKNLAINIEKEQGDYEKNKAVMSDAQKANKERELSLKHRELQRNRNDIQEMINIRRNEELAKIQILVNQVIKSIGEQQSFDLILYEGIAYTNSKIDITPQVLKKLEALKAQKVNDFNK